MQQFSVLSSIGKPEMINMKIGLHLAKQNLFIVWLESNLIWEKAASPKLWSLFRSAVEDEWVLLNGVPCKAAHPTPLASTAGRKDGGINQTDKNVWKYTSRRIICRQHLQHVLCFYGPPTSSRYEYVIIMLWEVLTICSVCTCRSSWARIQEYREPTRMAPTPCRWPNTLEHRIGTKSPETKPNV